MSAEVDSRSKNMNKTPEVKGAGVFSNGESLEPGPGWNEFQDACRKLGLAKGAPFNKLTMFNGERRG
jgi:hypothetical protein